MNPAQLLAHFDRISDAPDAVSQFRRFVRELAVRGKLVNQDPSEIAAKCFDIPDSVNGDDRLQTELPRGWSWAKVGDVSETRLGKMLDKSRNVGKAYRYLRNTNVQWFAIELEDLKSMLIADEEIDKFTLRKGDILICEGGHPGRAAVWRGEIPDMALQKALHRIRPSNLLDSDYFTFCLAVYFDAGILAKYYTGVGIPHLTGVSLAKIVFPLPPINEQHRIVAKVDELMVLCDRLEAAQREREQRRDRLNRASLHRLNDGADAHAFRDHTSFHLRHLPRLTTRPEHIRDLRQTILNLAVRGKLVAQNPDDESVLQFLSRIDAAREKLCETGERRTEAKSSSLLNDELAWSIPPSWTYRALADLMLFIDYRGKTPEKTSSGVRLITAKNVRSGVINLEPQEFISEKTYKAWMTRGLPQAGDVLFTTEAPMGNAAVVSIKERFALAQRTICLRQFGGLDPNFVALQIASQPFQQILDFTATGLTAKGIKAAKLRHLPFAIPPFAEQQRIVAKVRELMKLCDQLESQLTATQIETRRLLEAILHETLRDSNNGFRSTDHTRSATQQRQTSLLAGQT